MSEPIWQDRVDGAIEGFCFLHTETGTEGGYWAVQDRDYISKAMPDYGVHPRSEVFDSSDPERRGSVRVVEKLDGRPLPDPLVSDPEWLRDPRAVEKALGRNVYGIGHRETVRAVVAWDDGVSETRLSDSLLTRQWDYEGLHVLDDGDRLTIFDADGEGILWRGVIDLERHPSFTENASGWWIHADQRGIARDEWAKFFFAERPARLRKKGT